jgi:hypothetical protein
LLIKDDCVTTRFSKDELILKADVFDFVWWLLRKHLNVNFILHKIQLRYWSVKSAEASRHLIKWEMAFFLGEKKEIMFYVINLLQPLYINSGGKQGTKRCPSFILWQLLSHVKMQKKQIAKC